MVDRGDLFPQSHCMIRSYYIPIPQILFYRCCQRLCFLQSLQCVHVNGIRPLGAPKHYDPLEYHLHGHIKEIEKNKVVDSGDKRVFGV